MGRFLDRPKARRPLSKSPSVEMVLAERRYGAGLRTFFALNFDKANGIADLQLRKLLINHAVSVEVHFSAIVCPNEAIALCREIPDYFAMVGRNVRFHVESHLTRDILQLPACKLERVANRNIDMLVWGRVLSSSGYIDVSMAGDPDRHMNVVESPASMPSIRHGDGNPAGCDAWKKSLKVLGRLFDLCSRVSRNIFAQNDLEWKLEHLDQSLTKRVIVSTTLEFRPAGNG